ncbi:hypothetical protein B5C34_04130 [Pacificimonas flava]|uniref:TonB C-terminal domain-containing protein n=2 Tax=Pacificimonas TaxID=1960290 RepID=A0A219B309_9SPHN|nr:MULTISPECIES: energy transducer TonB [Pacificimonas]MBZ6377593.1 energy transducer TonB [Pacificimonas aurantium]OWV32717.1 hypothetical protein B5C34_04130 [Pacificimonas flava]
MKDRRPLRTRLAAFAGAVAVLGLSLWAIVSGLAVGWLQEAAETVSAAISITAPDEEATEEAASLEEGASADPSFREVPVEVAAPPPDILLEPPPVPAAPAPAEGTATDSGAAEEAGPGSGAGEGDGTGAGAGGFGPGGGGQTSARLVAGEIDDRGVIDAALARQRRTDIAEYRFLVLPTGRIFGCRPQKSSGNAALDKHMCDLLTARLRYKPARNARGDAVVDEKAYRQDWR